MRSRQIFIVVVTYLVSFLYSNLHESYWHWNGKTKTLIVFTVSH